MLRFGDGASFASGRAKYLDRAGQGGEVSAKIYVRVQLQGLEAPILAQLDTGAPWSVLDWEIAGEIGLRGGDGEEKTIATARGTHVGRLEQATILIVAEEGGSLEVTAQVFVSETWDGPTFLGYMGLLERIRFAVDPQQNDFYFGTSA